MKEEYGFEYVEKLCQAIEVFTADYEKKHRDVFIYRGTDLKYALERALYYEYNSDDRLYKLFTDWKVGQLSKTVFFFDEIQKELLKIICNGATGYIFIIFPKNFLRNIFSSIRFLVQNIFSKRINSDIIQVDTIFYIPQQRFAKHLQPIYDRMPLPLYLVNEKALSDSLKKDNLKAVNLVGGGNFRNILLKYGYLKKYGLTVLYDRLYKILSEIKPRVVVVPEGNAPDNEIVNRVCKQLKIPCICIQQGWSPFVHNGFRNMSFNKMLVWGEGFAKLLKPYNPAQKFVSVGSHIIRIKNNGIKDLENRKVISFFFQVPTRVITLDVFNQYIELTIWAAKIFPTMQVVVREHPGFPLDNRTKKKFSSLKNLRFMNSDKYKLEEVIDISFISVSIYSTTILESVAVGVLPIIFNPTSMPSYSPDVDIVGAGVEVKTLEDAKISIKKLINDKNFYKSFQTNMKKFRKEYFAYGGQQAINNIIKELK